eukprot:6186199-Pyramimonas_sp.AAC.1
MPPPEASTCHCDGPVQAAAGGALSSSGASRNAFGDNPASAPPSVGPAGGWGVSAGPGGDGGNAWQKRAGWQRGQWSSPRSGPGAAPPSSGGAGRGPDPLYLARGIWNVAA